MVCPQAVRVGGDKRQRKEASILLGFLPFIHLSPPHELALCNWLWNGLFYLSPHFSPWFILCSIFMSFPLLYLIVTDISDSFPILTTYHFDSEIALYLIGLNPYFAYVMQFVF